MSRTFVVASFILLNDELIYLCNTTAWCERGILIVEDIQPIQEANPFRAQFLPQIMKDLHYCGDPKQNEDDVCFPTLWKLLASIHCELHICVFERSDEPAIKDLSLEDSKSPKNALDLKQCKSMMNGHW